jgi:hypothetical protein
MELKIEKCSLAAVSREVRILFRVSEYFVRNTAKKKGIVGLSSVEGDETQVGLMDILGQFRQGRVPKEVSHLIALLGPAIVEGAGTLVIAVRKA